jgi:hypothetical protein
MTFMFHVMQKAINHSLRICAGHGQRLPKIKQITTFFALIQCPHFGAEQFD